MEADVLEGFGDFANCIDAVKFLVSIVFLAVVEFAGKEIMEDFRDEANDPDIVIPGIGSQENDLAAGLEDSVDFTEGFFWSGKVLENPGGNNKIESLVRERQVVSGGDNFVFDKSIPVESILIGINTVGVRSFSVNFFQKFAVSASNIENSSGR